MQNTTNTTQTRYAYTQHEVTVKVIETTCACQIIRLKQDRNRDPVEDVLSQLPSETLTQGAVLYAVMPIDKLVELKQKVPQLRIKLLQLDGNVVEKLTGKPYDPKAEYPVDIISQALKVIEIKGGTVRYTCLEGMVDEVMKKEIKKIAIFNDTMREGFKIALQRLGVNVELVKTCNNDECVEINPPGYRSGYRVSFSGTVGKLTPEQIADMLIAGTARIYYVEVDAEVVPLCD